MCLATHPENHRLTSVLLCLVAISMIGPIADPIFTKEPAAHKTGSTGTGAAHALYNTRSTSVRDGADDCAPARVTLTAAAALANRRA